MNLKRPLTQEPIGYATGVRRMRDARFSTLVATRPKDGPRRKAAA